MAALSLRSSGEERAAPSDGEPMHFPRERLRLPPHAGQEPPARISSAFTVPRGTGPAAQTFPRKRSGAEPEVSAGVGCD